MKLIKILLIPAVVMSCAVLIMVLNISLISHGRTVYEHSDYTRFEELTGFKGDRFLLVEAQRPGIFGTPGKGTYGLIVPHFSEESLLKNGWEIKEESGELGFEPGKTFDTIAQFYTKRYVRKMQNRTAILICSPYGNQEYAGNNTYLVFISTDYDPVSG